MIRHGSSLAQKHRRSEDETLLTYVTAFRTALAAAALWSVAGCGALTALGEASKPLDVYEIHPSEAVQPEQRRALAADIIVELPTTSGALQTDRIMIRPNSLQAEYLPDARWGEETPVMVQTLMLRAIEATQGVRYVGRQPLGVNGDYAIVTEIVNFQAELNEESETATVQLRLVSRIVRENDVRIVASRTFSASEIALSLDTNEIVQAFDTAATRLLSEFSSWVLSTLRAR